MLWEILILSERIQAEVATSNTVVSFVSLWERGHSSRRAHRSATCRAGDQLQTEARPSPTPAALVDPICFRTQDELLHDRDTIAVIAVAASLTRRFRSY